MVSVWKASEDVVNLLNAVKAKHHPRLELAKIAVSFEDSKPFVKNKLNLGKLSMFNPLARLWQGHQHDFCLSIPMDLWQDILTNEQREAYLDLQLTRCTVEYQVEEVEENGKKIKIKDEWGRVQYTQEPKLDEEGNLKWKVSPLDIEVYADNVRRYGLWSESLLDLKNAIANAPNCVQGDTLICMADAGTKMIKDIKKGDEIGGHDGP